MANDKVISTEALIEKFQYALKNKWGYIYGSAGEIWTEAKQKAATRTQTVKYGSQWVGHHVADCSGLFTWAFKELGGYMYHGSDTMFRKYTTATGQLKNGKRTDGKELKPGTAVFVWKEEDRKYSHVGLYIGNGYVIHANGVTRGVEMQKLDETKFTNWFEIPWIQYIDETVPEDPIESTEPTESTQ